MNKSSARNEKVPAPASRLPPPAPTNGQQAQPATHIAIPVETAKAIFALITSLSLASNAIQDGLPITITPKTPPAIPGGPAGTFPS